MKISNPIPCENDYRTLALKKYACTHTLHTHTHTHAAQPIINIINSFHFHWNERSRWAAVGRVMGIEWRIAWQTAEYGRHRTITIGRKKMFSWKICICQTHERVHNVSIKVAILDDGMRQVDTVNGSKCTLTVIYAFRLLHQPIIDCSESITLFWSVSHAFHFGPLPFCHCSPRTRWLFWRKFLSIVLTSSKWIIVRWRATDSWALHRLSPFFLCVSSHLLEQRRCYCLLFRLFGHMLHVTGISCCVWSRNHVIRWRILPLILQLIFREFVNDIAVLFRHFRVLYPPTMDIVWLMDSMTSAVAVKTLNIWVTGTIKYAHWLIRIEIH